MRKTFLLLAFLLAACTLTVPPAVSPATPSTIPTLPSALTAGSLPAMTALTLQLGGEATGKYISLDSGGDVDTLSLPGARQTGDGQVIPSADQNTVADAYMQFRVDDAALLAGWPTTSVRLDVEYLDQGTDTFNVQYDGLAGGTFGDGRFLESRPVIKTDSGEYRTASFVLKDVWFANRDNGADFRIADRLDGAETIRRVTVTLLPAPTLINVDECGADPWDDQPDSAAIQACIDQAKTGDTILFTSGEETPGYVGYRIDQTVFMNLKSPRSYLTFTSTDPSNPALLQATADLKGFVLKLFARSRLGDSSGMDYMTITSLHLDGNRLERTCVGQDGIANGVDDNWGSWLPECTNVWDSWCNPGTLDLAGELDWSDPTQDYPSHPERWTSGHLVANLLITNTECGTAFGMGGAASVILNNTVRDAGDHVHAPGCLGTDADVEQGDWADGITFVGPGHLVMNNTVINPSDVGIVFFGGRATVIRDNTIRITAGNFGAFAGIAIHPWSLGDISFGQVTGNTILSLGDETCGNLHTGINLGTHMWGGACLNNLVTPAIGNPGCTLEPAPPAGSLCPSAGACQLWASVAQPGSTYLFTDNQVSGAQINYLVEGLDLVGSLIEQNNLSTAPRLSDWEAARRGCNGLTWGPLDKVAHHPSLPGWTDLLVHCER